MVEVKVRNGDVIKALYFFNRKVGKAGILQELRKRKHFEKKSTLRHKRNVAIKKFGV